MDSHTLLAIANWAADTFGMGEKTLDQITEEIRNRVWDGFGDLVERYADHLIVETVGEEA